MDIDSVLEQYKREVILHHFVGITYPNSKKRFRKWQRNCVMNHRVSEAMPPWWPVFSKMNYSSSAVYLPHRKTDGQVKNLKTKRPRSIMIYMYSPLLTIVGHGILLQVPLCHAQAIKLLSIHLLETCTSSAVFPSVPLAYFRWILEPKRQYILPLLWFASFEPSNPSVYPDTNLRFVAYC